MRGLAIFAAGVAGGLAAPAAMAQNSQSPMIITVPGVERYSLPPSNTQASAPTPSPASSPTPTPAPIAAPPPVVPTVRATPRPTPRATPAPPRLQPTAAAPTPIPTPTPSAGAVPAVTASPSPAPVAPPLETAPAAPVSAAPPWPWLAGGALALLAGGAALWWWRRRRPEMLEAAAAPAPVVAPTPPLAATPPLPSRPPAPPPTPAALPAVARPLTAEVLPAGVSIGNGAAALEFELAVTNTGAQAADGIRIALGMVTAGPDLEARIAAFGASAGAMPAGEPLSLAPGETHRARGSLTLPIEAMHVAKVGGRPMVVPVVLVHLRWRGGLSIRGQGDAFMIGTGDAAVAKLGPIWLDRGPRRYAPVSARRFDPAPARPRAA
ncbi:hypothetical protein [Sphingomonas sp. DT-204]|uniref:hypothetical protein n=1 Tax=Sphingomonas sp. DT-204 TaxID=3396166 RepID=UPI003F1CC98D